MSNCQKHKNHHCVHSHNCKDPHHKKKHRTPSANGKQTLKKNINQKYHPPMGTILDNDECQFIYSSAQQPFPINNRAYNQSLAQEIEHLKGLVNQKEKRNKALTEQNNHLQCQIQYLRQQLDLLVSNHNSDISKQIKRHLVENTGLNLRIKDLSAKLYDKEKQLDELSSENYSLGRKNKQFDATIKNYEQKIRILTLKNSELATSLTESKTKNKSFENQLRQLNLKYNTLASSSEQSNKKAQTLLSQITSTKESLQKSSKSKENEINKIKQLHEIEKKGWEKTIADIREKVFKKDEECKRLSEKTKNAEEEILQLRDDLQHAKKRLIKYQKTNQQCEKFNSQLKNSLGVSEHQSEQIKSKPTQIKQKQVNESLMSQIDELRKHNDELKQQLDHVKTLQQPFLKKTNTFVNTLRQQNLTNNVIINEELILSIGASEEFKKILEQKNATIKKLMREKAELYNKIYDNQLHGVTGNP